MKEKIYKIELYGVKKRLGGKQVLDGLDLKIVEGETFVMIGQSGVGKSVLLKHIIGLMSPDEGEIYIDNENMTDAEEAEWVKKRKYMGMLFQGGALFDSLTVGQNLLFALEQIRTDIRDEDEQERRILEALETVGLPGVEDFMPSDLSGGMMKRVALARAIVTEPRIVLFDEPTTGLDPIMTANINELILSVKKKLNTTFVVVTHDIQSARTIADRIGMVYKGKMIFLGSVKDLDKTQDPYVNQFIQGLSSGPITAEQQENWDHLRQDRLSLRRP